MAMNPKFRFDLRKRKLFLVCEKFAASRTSFVDGLIGEVDTTCTTHIETSCLAQAKL